MSLVVPEASASPRAARVPLTTNVFSVDVEDWYQGVFIPESQWGGFASRIEASMDGLLGLLAEAEVKATCFVLGRVAEEHPDLVRRIAQAGHEVATHGYSHAEVYTMTPAQFRTNLRGSIDRLEDLTGQQVLGYRAPYFSITAESLWALEILREEGLRYDSSIRPARHHRAGIAHANPEPSYFSFDSGRLLEIPVSTFMVNGVRSPIGGGAYLRLLPYRLTRRILRRLERQGEGLSLYTHPWELDTDMPRLDLPRLVYLTHYFNLRSTKPKLRALLRDFAFTTYREAYGSRLDP